MRMFDMLTRADIKRLKGDEGPLGLAKQIEELQKQKEYLQNQCRKAGRAMIELNVKYESNLKEVEELKADLSRAKEDHQYDNLVHKHELERLTKK